MLVSSSMSKAIALVLVASL
jgi:hypothetical protein